MIKKLQESKGSVLGFKITGKVSTEEENKWIEKFEDVIKEHGKISVLVVLGEKASWGIEAGIKDVKWIMTHMKNLNKIAVVSDSKVWKWLITVDRQFAKMVGIGEKHFELSQIDNAWSWVNK